MRKATHEHTFGYSHPVRPSDKDNDRQALTQIRLARTHGTHDTHTTKTKTKRSQSPGYDGLTSQTVFEDGDEDGNENTRRKTQDGNEDENEDEDENEAPEHSIDF